MTNLPILSVNGNLLAGPIPTELGRLSALAYLWLHENALSGSIPSELAELTSLKEFFVQANDLVECSCAV